jgi:leucyl aminopeptidase (aminopeptidase T)
MEKADIVIVMTYGGLVHTQARKRAVAAGVKYTLMSDMTKEYLIAFDLTREDLLQVRTQTEEIVRKLTAADSAHLTTKAGTDIVMSLKGRKGVGLVPFAAKGTFFGVPGYAEAACPPIEDSAEGILVVDGTMIGTEELEGLVEEPFEIRFNKGRIVGISGGKDGRKLEGILKTLEDQARTFSELGINSNFMVPKKLWGSRMDMAVGGHVHIALGRNDHIGGNSRAETHLDLLVTYATLRLDGDTILEDGILKM